MSICGPSLMIFWPNSVILSNLLASIDLETTGLQAGYHEPIQIAIVPLNSDIRPLEGVRSFYTTIKPE
jgi:DNA polymerase III epsilon subunit-like protein